MENSSQEDDTLSSPHNTETENAFAFMMMSQSNKQTSNRKRPRNHHQSDPDGAKSPVSSRFVLCPYCSKSISSVFIQVHVEKCSSNLEFQHQENLKQEQKKAKIFDKHRANVANGATSKVIPDKNAFTKMMDQSKQWNFGDNKASSEDPSGVNRKAKRQQWFHLTKDMKVIWISDQAANDGVELDLLKTKVDRLCGEINWSSSILIHASKMNETNLDNVELNVTSSIPPSSSSMRPFVQNHSRLSIPVLKSILQKSVRRRRPLPSVKVAMELADKALGELLRRLPIICIEDSTLHHDFPFLIWIMVAQSKQFQPTKLMMTRVFQAVFEIASCPWKDNLRIPKDTYEDHSEEPKDLSLTAMSNTIGEAKRDEMMEDADCDLMIRSILLRHKYGGMGCDLRMLQQYARVWQYRFVEEKVMNQQLAKVCLPKHCEDSATKSIRWSHVPNLLHPVERSSKAVAPLLARPLPYLRYADVTPAGVDFHCSNVLDVPLYNIKYQSKIQELYWGNTEPSRKLTVQDIGGILKSACWDHSSGVNYRRTFRQAMEPDPPNQSANAMKDEENDRIKQVWDFIAPSVQTFAKNYLTEKLVAPS